jgi:hypothetical protein
VAEDRLLVVENAYEDKSFKAADERSGFITRSILCARCASAMFIGAVQVLTKRPAVFFDGEAGQDAAMLQVMANAAPAISNARLADQLLEQERIKRELNWLEIQQPAQEDDDLPICGINARSARFPAISMTISSCLTAPLCARRRFRQGHERGPADGKDGKPVPLPGKTIRDPAPSFHSQP